MKAADYRAMVTGRKFARETAPKRPKYRNKKTVVDGITFDSKREASRYNELKIAEKSGTITKLRLQVPFAIVVNRIYCGSYVSDFVYLDRDGEEIIEDAKGVRSDLYKLKKKLVEALYGVAIVEV